MQLMRKANNNHIHQKVIKAWKNYSVNALCASTFFNANIKMSFDMKKANVRISLSDFTRPDQINIMQIGQIKIHEIIFIRIVQSKT